MQSTVYLKFDEFGEKNLASCDPSIQSQPANAAIRENAKSDMGDRAEIG